MPSYSKNIFFLLIPLILFNKCGFSDYKKQRLISIQLSDDQKALLYSEVEGLSVDSEREGYLGMVFEEDQKVRTNLKNAGDQFGYNSQQYKDASKSMDTVDSQNLYRMKLYLHQHGYPPLANFSEKANHTPLLVFHHKASINEFKEYFQIFNEAYQSRDISPSQFQFALNRLYNRIHNERFLKEGEVYNEKELVDKLISTLNLDG